MDSCWYYNYLTPFGDILREGETPYDHKSNPYVFKAYPFIDGEVHSFVGDVIDQQRYSSSMTGSEYSISQDAPEHKLSMTRAKSVMLSMTSALF